MRTQYAVEQGEAAAERLLAGGGAAKPFDAVPFVWSDQFELKIQVAGWISPDDDLHLAHADENGRRFVALFGRGGKLMGAVGFNRARQHVRYRMLIRDGASWEAALEHAER